MRCVAECDRIALRQPILGLYGEYYREWLLAVVAARAGAESIVDLSDASPGALASPSDVQVAGTGAGADPLLFDPPDQAQVRAMRAARMRPAPWHLRAPRCVSSRESSLSQRAGPPHATIVLIQPAPIAPPRSIIMQEDWFHDAHKARTFPKTFELALSHGVVRTTELFGDLIARMERRQKHDVFAISKKAKGGVAGVAVEPARSAPHSVPPSSLAAAEPGANRTGNLQRSGALAAPWHELPTLWTRLWRTASELRSPRGEDAPRNAAGDVESASTTPAAAPLRPSQ
jgi:hypothetical protein